MRHSRLREDRRLASSFAGPIWPGLVLASLAFLAGVAILRPGEPWAGDFALYLMHAQNIAHGIAYAATNYIHNPAHAWISPAAYPPGLPLLLAPFVGLFGLNFPVLHAVILATLIAWALFGFRLAQRTFTTAWACLLLLATFATPLVAAQRDQVLSEFPFGALALGAIWLAEIGLARDRISTGRAVALAALLAAAICTRSIGLALLPGIAGALLLRRPYGWLRAIALLCLGTILAIALQRWLGVDSGTYLDLAKQRPPSWLAYLEGGLVAMRTHLHWLLRFDIAEGSAAAIATDILLALGTIGLFVRLRRPGALDVSLWALLLLILLYPVRSEMARYLLPAWPLLLIAIATPFYFTGRRLPSRLRLLPLLVFAALFITATLPFWRGGRAHLASASTQVHTPLFDAIRAATPQDAVLLSSNPRIIALFTDRHSAIWPEAPTDESFFAYADQIGARWIVEDRVNVGLFMPEMRAILRRNEARLRLLYQDQTFALWAIE